MGALPFFFATWEEYYTNRLNLPIINGVCDGAILGAIMLSATGIVGSDSWLLNCTVFGYTFPYRTYAVYIFLLISSLFIVNNLKNVYEERKDTFFECLQNTFSFFFLIVSLLIVANFSNSKLAFKYPNVVLYLYGFIFAKLVAQIQLAHLCMSKFQQFKINVLASPLILIVITIFK